MHIVPPALLGLTFRGFQAETLGVGARMLRVTCPSSGSHEKLCAASAVAGNSSFKFKFKVRPAGPAVTAGSAAGSESCTSSLAAAGTGADLSCTHAGE